MRILEMTNNRGLWVFSSILLVLLLVNSYYIYNLNEQVSSLKGTIKDISGPELVSVLNESQNPVLSVTQKSIPIVAVSNDESGVMAGMNLKLTPGSNDILVNTNPFLEPDLQYALKTAVTYAQSRDSGYKADKDFIFNFSSTEAQLIGGESAGAAATVLTIAALENKELKSDAVITGTISGDGTIGEIGGVLEKAKAVSDAGYKYFLIPKGQSEITYYERQVQRQSTDQGFDILRSRYVPRTLDLVEAAKDEWGLNVIEVSNIDEALPYFIEG
jgi:predicted S18 family serine protease